VRTGKVSGAPLAVAELFTVLKHIEHLVASRG
jgi:hypothetical protein